MPAARSMALAGIATLVSLMALPASRGLFTATGYDPLADRLSVMFASEPVDDMLGPFPVVLPFMMTAFTALAGFHTANAVALFADSKTFPVPFDAKTSDTFASVPAAVMYGAAPVTAETVCR